VFLTIAELFKAKPSISLLSGTQEPQCTNSPCVAFANRHQFPTHFSKTEAFFTFADALIYMRHLLLQSNSETYVTQTGIYDVYFKGGHTAAHRPVLYGFSS